VIGSLRGVLADRVMRSDNLAEVLLEAGGVGYRVLVPAGSVSRAGEVGEPSFLWVHTHVREDALVLYGFCSREERDCFELLLGAVLGEAMDALALVPGIGKKTAARLVLELAPRFEAAPVGLDGSAGEPGAPGPTREPGRAVHEAPVAHQVREALVSLGYGADEVRSVLAHLSGDAPPEEMLRHALRELAGSR
jgi:Holliday junction DNA helicase RuvA